VVFRFAEPKKQYETEFLFLPLTKKEKKEKSSKRK
jgi:hypothetical protein